MQLSSRHPPLPPHTQQPHALPFGSSEESWHECLYGLHVPGLALCSDPWHLWCLVCLRPPICHLLSPFMGILSGTSSIGSGSIYVHPSAATLNMLQHIEDPTKREVASDALSAIDRMECTVNDVRTCLWTTLPPPCTSCSLPFQLSYPLPSTQPSHSLDRFVHSLLARCWTSASWTPICSP